jgi:hypothetical protein
MKEVLGSTVRLVEEGVSSDLYSIIRMDGLDPGLMVMDNLLSSIEPKHRMILG